VHPYSIGIDARMWRHPGIGRYLRELTEALLSESGNERFIFLGDRSLRKEFSKHSDFRETRSKIYGLGEQWEIPRLARDLDLLHVPHFNIPIFSGPPLVVTVHDLTYFHDPKASRSKFSRAYASYFLRKVTQKASAVLTVSEYTKKDLLEAFPGLSADRVFVTHEAAAPTFKKISDSQTLEEIKQRYGLHTPYVLFVGSLRPHKNIPALIKAMAVLRDRKKIPHDLVLVGKKEAADPELLDLISRNPFVRVVGEVPDEALAALYNLADLFVLPSFREGFGLPLVEAMACGTPVLAARATSLPEIGADAARYFDPASIDALSELLYNVLIDSDLRQTMRAAGLRRAKEFSWEKTAVKTLEVYRYVLRTTG